MSLRIIPFVALFSLTASAADLNLSTPQNAAKSLYQAVEAQDGVAVVACFYAATPDEQELARTFADMIVAAKKLNDAAKNKFGGTGEALGAGMIGKDEAAKVDSAEVKIRGATATLTVPGQPRPMKFHKSGGKWQLVVADYAGATPENLPGQLQLLKKVTAVMSDTAGEILADKYPTADEAGQAIQQKLALVMIRAAQPTTKPVKDEKGKE